ncbi:MAG: PPOX class F420-dependent oxidoreductase [Pseudomonadales bacterium]
MPTALRHASYVSLATFRKSGAEVATPVWVAHDNGEFFIFSAGNAGKVKRLRNSPRARLAVCDVRGKLLGEWHDATAEILEHPGDKRRALRLLRRKYGWQMWLADTGAKLTGRFHRRAYIRARLVQPPA